MSQFFGPIFLIVIPLTVILTVIIRKLPQISLLDVENLPEVKDKKRRDEVLKIRVERDAKNKGRSLSRRLRPVNKWLRELQLSFRKYVGKVKRKVEKEDRALKSPKEPKQISLLEDESMADKKDWRETEKKLLQTIKKNPRDAFNYKALADLYYENEQVLEAIETYKFVLKLDSDDEEVKERLEELLT